VSLENGLILAYDSRTLSNSSTPATPKYTLSAHDGAAAALDINPHIRGCIATGGMDKLVKIWNITDEETEGEKGRKREISLATSRDLGLVSFSSSFFQSLHLDFFLSGLLLHVTSSSAVMAR